MFGRKIVKSFYYKDVEFPRKYNSVKKEVLDILAVIEEDRKQLRSVTQYIIDMETYKNHKKLNKIHDCLLSYFDINMIPDQDSSAPVNSFCFVDIGIRKIIYWFGYCDEWQHEIIESKITNFINVLNNTHFESFYIILNLPKYIIERIIRQVSHSSEVIPNTDKFIEYRLSSLGYSITIRCKEYRDEKEKYDKEKLENETFMNNIHNKAKYNEILSIIGNNFIKCFERDESHCENHEETVIDSKFNKLCFCYLDEKYFEKLLARKGYSISFEQPEIVVNGIEMIANEKQMYNNKLIKIKRIKDFDYKKQVEEISKMKDIADKYGFAIVKFNDEQHGSDPNIFKLDVYKEFITELDRKLSNIEGLIK